MTRGQVKVALTASLSMAALLWPWMLGIVMISGVIVASSHISEQVLRAAGM